MHVCCGHVCTDRSKFVTTCVPRCHSAQYACLLQSGIQHQSNTQTNKSHACAADLGQGVNSALLDVGQLYTSLQESSDVQAALADYERKRLPENHALMKLQQVCIHLF